MVEEEYLGEEDEVERMLDTEEQAEDQQDLQDDVYGDTTPSYKDKDDLYTLFWKVVKTTESSKVGNLNKIEIGMLDISVRDCQKIALLARTLGHNGFANFFDRQAEIILATSASKEGWLPELFVSQKKFSTKSKGGNIANLGIQQPKKKGLFGKFK